MTLLHSYSLRQFYTTITFTYYLPSIPACLPWHPQDCCFPQLRPEVSLAGTGTAAVHDTCSPKNLCLCFISLPPLPTHPLLSPLDCTTPFGTGDPPRGPVLHPSLALRAASSSSSLNPYWNPAVSDNQRHLSQEPAAQTMEDTAKKGPNSLKDSQKNPSGSCWELFCVDVDFSNPCHQTSLTALYHILPKIKYPALDFQQHIINNK